MNPGDVFGWIFLSIPVLMIGVPLIIGAVLGIGVVVEWFDERKRKKRNW